MCDCEVPAWKVASGELTNHRMVRRMVETGKPILLSSGMSSWSELDEVTGLVTELGGEFAMFQCTTSYPCPPEKWGLNVIGEMRDRYQCPVGLSDHSGTIVPSTVSIPG